MPFLRLDHTNSRQVMLSKKQILDLISKGDTGKAIGGLLENTRLLDDELHQEVALQSAKYERYKKDERSGTQEPGSQDVRLSRINHALIEITGKLQQGIPVDSVSPNVETLPLKGYSNKPVALAAILLMFSIVGIGGIFYQYQYSGGDSKQQLNNQDSIEAHNLPVQRKVGDTQSLKKIDKKSINNEKSQSAATAYSKRYAIMGFYSLEDPYGLLQDAESYIENALAQRQIIRQSDFQLNSAMAQQMFENGFSLEITELNRPDGLALFCKYLLTQEKAHNDILGQEVTTDKQILEIKIYDLEKRNLIKSFYVNDIAPVRSLAGDDKRKIENENREELKKAINKINFKI